MKRIFPHFILCFHTDQDLEITNNRNPVYIKHLKFVHFSRALGLCVFVCEGVCVFDTYWGLFWA